MQISMMCVPFLPSTSAALHCALGPVRKTPYAVIGPFYDNQTLKPLTHPSYFTMVKQALFTQILSYRPIKTFFVQKCYNNIAATLLKN